MRVLQDWLKEFVSFDLAPRELAEKLGMLGLEVEHIENYGEKFAKFVVGQVLSVERHPNADRLTVCKVNTGKETTQIVCGAPNVADGQKVAVGLAGAVIPRGQHDPSAGPFTLSRVKIRGVESNGMICSEFELGVGDDADGILVLKPSARVGAPLAKVLGLDDIAYEIEVTPNRPDWLGHVGVAREIGIFAGRGALRVPKPRVKEGTRRTASRISVKIEDGENCGRFGVRIIEGVTVGESPEWLRNRLQGLGLRPVNNIVDVTNYVMYEAGHPLHAFDYIALKGQEILVRQTKASKSFDTLDGKTVRLPRGTVMVCDAEREVSIAGIIGGANSEIGNTTTDVVLEAAHWNPSNIRRSAKELGINTDASYRFERGTDPNAIPYVLNRTAELIQDVAGGIILKGLVDVYPGKVRARKVPLRTDRVNALLGTDLKAADIRRCLKPLGIAPASSGSKKAFFTVPTFRVDIEREVDLIEEVARVYGYDRIPEKAGASLELESDPFRQNADDIVRQTVIGFGFREAVTFPMVSNSLAKVTQKRPITILNPLNIEMDSMRTSLLPGLLDIIARNIRHGNVDLRLFEIGHVFGHDASAKGNLVEDIAEEDHLAMAVCGLAKPSHWGSEERNVDFFDLKGEVESLLNSLSLDKCRFISYPTSDSLVEEAVGVESQGAYAGYLGQVRGDFLKLFGIEQPVFVAELRMDSLIRTSNPMYKPLPRFPRVRRDVAFVVDHSAPSSQIEKALLDSSSGLLKQAELFDLYQGDPLPPGKKGLAFSLEIVPTEKTLTDTEIDKEIGRAVTAVEKQFGAKLRS